jgi:hypothetical protein
MGPFELLAFQAPPFEVPPFQPLPFELAPYPPPDPPKVLGLLAQAPVAGTTMHAASRADAAANWPSLALRRSAVVPPSFLLRHLRPGPLIDRRKCAQLELGPGWEAGPGTTLSQSAHFNGNHPCPGHELINRLFDA